MTSNLSTNFTLPALRIHPHDNLTQLLIPFGVFCIQPVPFAVGFLQRRGYKCVGGTLWNKHSISYGEEKWQETIIYMRGGARRAEFPDHAGNITDNLRIGGTLYSPKESSSSEDKECNGLHGCKLG